MRPDTLAGEEPLEIRLGGEPLTVTMRTPGHDFDLVAGFLVSEGVIGAGGELIALRYCAGATGQERNGEAPRAADPDLHLAGSAALPPGAADGVARSWAAPPSPASARGENSYNVIDATLTPGVRAPTSSHRTLLTTSACGICGKDTVDAVRTNSRWPVADDPVRLTPETLYSLPGSLRAAQRAFDATGGLHAAGLFTAEGRLLCAREDVGRHNAVDKVIGWALRADRLPLTGCVLAVSGRASFELTQKAVMAGIPVLTAVSAPSSLAVDLAKELGLTLVGFLRGETANVYTTIERIAVPGAAVTGGVA